MTAVRAGYRRVGQCILCTTGKESASSQVQSKCPLQKKRKVSLLSAARIGVVDVCDVKKIWCCCRRQKCGTPRRSSGSEELVDLAHVPVPRAEIFFYFATYFGSHIYCSDSRRQISRDLTVYNECLIDRSCESLPHLEGLDITFLFIEGGNCLQTHKILNISRRLITTHFPLLYEIRHCDLYC